MATALGDGRSPNATRDIRRLSRVDSGSLRPASSRPVPRAPSWRAIPASKGGMTACARVATNATPATAPAQHVGVIVAELHDRHATHRMADQHRVVEVEGLEDGGHVGRQARDAVAVAAGRRLAVAPQVDGDDPVAVGQLVELGSPHLGGQGDAVEQHQRSAIASLHDVQRPAVRGGHRAVGDIGRHVEQLVGRRLTVSAGLARPPPLATPGPFGPIGWAARCWRRLVMR